MQVRYDDQIVMSPSQVMLWLRCPYLWQNRNKLFNENIRLGQYAALVIALYRKNRSIPTPRTEKRAQVAEAAIQAANTTFFSLGAPLHTELTLGCCRVDEVFGPLKLSGVENNVTATIIDYKYVPTRLTSKELDASFDYYRYQLLHYAWAYSQYTQTWGTSLCQYEIGLCVFSEDKSVDLRTHIVTYTQLEQWLTYAIHLWITIPRLPGWRNPLSCRTALYGECPLYKECWAELDFQE